MLRAAMNASFGGLGMRSFMSASAPRSKDMLGALNQLKMGSQRGRAHVMLRASNLRDNLLELLHEEGFVGTYHREGQHFRVNLKYHDNNKPVLSEVQTVGKASRRYQRGTIGPTHGRMWGKWFTFRSYKAGLGLEIVSTQKGVMSAIDARRLRLGGFVVARIY
ncbi:MAG: hypothetical protein MHM6MM_000187 [Cercozoa sp. M6MM]